MGIKVSKGPAGHAASLFGKTADGKGAKSLNLHAPGAGLGGSMGALGGGAMGPVGGPAPGAASDTGGPTGITGGNALSRSMGQYGKGHSYLPGSSDPDTNLDPTAHAGSSNSQIRGAAGGIKSRPRQGGLQDGPASMPSTPMDD